MSTTTPIDLQQIPVLSLATYHRNPRRGNVDEIAASLDRLGQYRPLVVNAGTLTGRPLEVLAGNHTLLAARQLGWETVTAGVIDVDDEHAARIVAADNRTADLGHYDDRVLLELLAGLPDLAGTGYTSEDLDALAALGATPVALTDPDDVPSVDRVRPPVSEVGDVWHLGPHRLLVGDCTDVAAIEGMLDGDRCHAMWTDPPYGVNYVGGTGMTIMNDGADDLDDLLPGFLAAATIALRPGAPFYIAHPGGPLSMKFTDALRDSGWGFRQQLVWVKNALVLGRSDYQPRHEPVLAGVTPGDPLEDGEDLIAHTPLLYGFTPGGDGRLGRGGPNWHGDNKQTTVFEIPKPPRNPDHPTMKPVELITAMLRNSVRPGALVYEPFAGSGSTLIACHTLGLRARVIELDPKYADVICRRWQTHTGQAPRRHTPDGDPVDFTTGSTS